MWVGGKCYQWHCEPKWNTRATRTDCQYTHIPAPLCTYLYICICIWGEGGGRWVFRFCVSCFWAAKVYLFNFELFGVGVGVCVCHICATCVCAAWVSFLRPLCMCWIRVGPAAGVYLSQDSPLRIGQWPYQSRPLTSPISLALCTGTGMGAKYPCWDIDAAESATVPTGDIVNI